MIDLAKLVDVLSVHMSRFSAIIHCIVGLCVVEKYFRLLLVAAVIVLLLANEPDRLCV